MAEVRIFGVESRASSCFICGCVVRSDRGRRGGGRARVWGPSLGVMCTRMCVDQKVEGEACMAEVRQGAFGIKTIDDMACSMPHATYAMHMLHSVCSVWLKILKC